MDLLSACSTWCVPAGGQRGRRGGCGPFVTQRPARRDAVTTWIHQFEPFHWLNLVAGGHHEVK